MHLDTELLREQREWLVNQPACPEADGLIALLDNLLAAQSMLDRLLTTKKPLPQLVGSLLPNPMRRGL
jgi:hypothetical protein